MKIISGRQKRAHENTSKPSEATTFDRSLSEVTSLNEVVTRIAERYGKPIRIEAIGDAEWETLTGLWIDYKDYGRILVRSTDPAIYQTHCILHELAHIALDHAGCRALAHEISPPKHGRDTHTQMLRIRARLLDANDHDAAADEVAAEEIAYTFAKLLMKPRHAEDESVFG
jgi:hypothetical protein